MGTKKRKKNNELTPEQIDELIGIINSNPNLKQQGKLGEFLDLFIVCEATARKLIEYAGYKVPTVNEDDSKFRDYTVTQIVNLSKIYFSSLIDEDTIDRIFKSRAKAGEPKTCRQLRNGYIHTMSPTIRTEIENRIVELRDNMNKWISLILDLQTLKNK